MAMLNYQRVSNLSIHEGMTGIPGSFWAFDLGRQEEVVPARNPLDQLLMHDFWQITPIWTWNYKFVWPQFPPILDDFGSVMVPQRLT